MSIFPVIKYVGLMSMKQKMEKMISTLREKARRTRLVRKAVGLGLAIVMLLETPSWSGLIKSALAHEDKAGAGRCIYVDTSLIGADSDVMESGIGAYVYNREGGSYSDAPIIMEKVEGKRNIYQLVLDDYYTYVEFTKGSDLNTGTKTGALAIDWSLGSPCYMFNSEALSDGGYFYGLYSVYFDLNGAPDASAFADNGVGIYAYNSDEDAYTTVPVAMKASGKGDGVYEYSFDKPYDCIAFMGGYGSWNYEVATTPVYMDWSYSAPCFFLEQVNGQESTGIWRNIRYTVYFDASDIKDDEAFIENGVWLYAFNDSGDKLSEEPVKMVASSVGSYLYEYTMERPYENLQFILGDSLDAEVSSEILYNDWLTYAEPCYMMTLDRKEILKASPSPSMTPSASPSGSPSATPSVDPSASPSGSPSATPSASPSGSPSATPSMIPSASPSGSPSATPSIIPTATPSIEPTETPAPTPTEIPAPTPTEIPTVDPTDEPTASPTGDVDDNASKGEDTDSESEGDTDSESEEGNDSQGEEGPGSESEGDTVSQDDTILVEARITDRTAFAAGNLTVTYGSYEMPWIGTAGGDDDIAPNAIEADEESESDDQPTEVETTDPETPAVPEESSDVSADENPAPTTDDEIDGTLEPTDDLDMISPSPSAFPEEIEDDVVVKTSISLISSTGGAFLLQSAGALSRALGGGTEVVYFDPWYTREWEDNNWGDVYIHLFHEGVFATDLIKMQPSSRINPETGSQLLEIDLSSYLTEAQMQNTVYALFVPQKDWPAEVSPNYLQTVNIELTGTHPCYWLTGDMELNPSDNKTKRAVGYVDLGPESQGGNPIYFVDMTSQLNGDIVAVFGGEGITDSSDVELSGTTTKKCEIPRDNENVLDQPYSTVTFYVRDVDGNKVKIGETYNLFNRASDGIKGFSYAENTMDTFYYGITEKADGTTISTWGARPSETAEELSGKTLYFDKLYFKVPKTVDGDDGATGNAGTDDANGAETLGAQFQIGDGELIPLKVDEEDARTYIHIFDNDPTATSQTILTYIDQDGTKYHFFWDKFVVESTSEDNDLVILEDEIAKVDGKYELGNWIYFDATMSKLANESNNSEIPQDFGVYCMMAEGPSGENAKTLEMTKVEDRGTWKDVWKIDVPDNYTYVKFANYKISSSGGKYANGTDYQKVPNNLFDPCFYADTGDDAIYGNNWRGGYWAEVYTIRDPEEIKQTPVVDITQADYTKNAKRLYVKTTLYDYYSDYELNGNNRDNLSGFENMSARDWVPFREFNQALSDYYEEAGESIPLYTGHFQPHDLSGAFSGKLADALNLYGYGNEHNFFSTNNSMMDITGAVDEDDYSRIARGFVADELKDGQIYSSGNRAVLPYFNEDFLAGDNSKNAVLGKVYEDVSFPFELMDNYHENEPGVSYWVYDSDLKSLEMKKTSNDEYYLYEDETQPKKGWSKNMDSKGDAKETYGFFPFNSGSNNGARSYNYGYAAKLEIKFRLTEDGQVEKETTGDEKADIKFDFSGDDDVWVFIDGHLALDMGGVHSPAHGTLNFATREYTISSVKKSAGSSSLETKGSFQIDGFENEKYDTREHTLTMFYMERGMWESNMKISFNFPDENQLEVQKKVDTSDVNDLFKTTFNDQKIFEFSIRNLATHFAPQTVTSTEAQEPPVEFNPAFEGISATADANTFTQLEGYEGHSGVAYWLAKESDSSGAYRDLRYGVIPGSADASKMKYLQFSYFYAGSGYPSLSDMYLRIDTDSGSSTHTLSGKIEGSASMKRGEWSTLTIDLNKFFGTDTINRANITGIRFGYNYSQPFYLDDFIFKPEAGSQKLTGFITKQPEIPDYGSATSAQLEIPAGAVFTRKLDGVADTYGMIDKGGTFSLENGETVLFRDQFRRGSYIELTELLSSPVFTTTWTMYENDQPVKAMGTGSTVQNTITGGLINQQGVSVSDGRTEKYSEESKDGAALNAGNNYTEDKKPTVPVFVFRSYSEPDSDAGVTKLKVVYTNKVNVGSLTIKKSQADGSQALTEEYQFRVTFTNVAGMGLEGETPITTTFKLKAGGEKVISGIPLNTEFVIEELKPADKSFLEGVTKESDGGEFEFNAETGQVKGKINIDYPAYTFNFSNMLKPTMSIEVTKIWKDAAGEIMADSDCPENLYIRLQRRVKGSNGDWVDVEKYKESVKLGTVGYERIWKYKFSDLEKYVDNTDHNKGMYEYRVVEVEVETDADGKITKETVVENNGFWDNFQVSYQDKSINGKDTDDPYNEELYSTEITNVHTVSLKVKKVDASGQPLGGVSFQLQRKDSEGNWKPVNVIVNDSETDTITTPSEEENPVGGAGVIIFSNLPSGEYQLVETATAPGHTLLASPIPIIINTDGSFTYTINGEQKTPVGNTIELTIKNGQNLVMPATGGAGPIPFTVGGLSICMIASLMYIDSMRKRRKEGKAS